MRIPASLEEILSMQDKEQEEIGELMGRMYTADPQRAEQITGVPSDQVIQFISNLKQDTAKRTEQIKYTVPPSPSGPVYPSPKQSIAAKQSEDTKQKQMLYLMDIRTKKKIPVFPLLSQPALDKVSPAPYDVLIRQKEGSEPEILAYGARAKGFDMKEGY